MTFILPNRLSLPIAAIVGILSFAGPYVAPGRAQVQPETKSSSPTLTPAASLARYVARDDLAIYIECVGLDSSADAWKKTSAYKILNDTSAGAMLEDLAAQLLEKTPLAGPGKQLTGADVIALVKHSLRNGFVIARNLKLGSGGQTPDPASVVSVDVFRGAGRKENRPLFAKLIANLRVATDKTEIVPKPGKRRVVVNTAAQPGRANWAWWVEKDEDLVFVQGDQAVLDRVIETFEKKKPDAIDHPVRSRLSKADGEFQPVLFGFLETSVFPATTQANVFFSKLGVQGVKRLEYRFGFEGPALMSVTRLVVPSPRTGLLAILDQPAFDIKSLPPVPGSQEAFSSFSMDPRLVYDKLVAAAKAANAQAAQQVDAFEKSVKGKTRLRFREDVLGMIGPRMAFYSTPPKAPAAASPLAGLMGGGLQVPKTVLVAEVKDSVAFGKALDELMLVANKALEDQAAAQVGAGGASDPVKPKAGGARKGPPAAKFKQTSAAPKTYVLSLPPAQAAFSNLNLTIAVGKKYVIIASASDVARQILALESKTEGRWSPTGDLNATLERLPKGLTFLQVADPSKTLPESLANLPATVQVIGSTLAAANQPGAVPGMMTPQPPPGAGPASNPLAGDDAEKGSRGRGRGRGARGPALSKSAGGGGGPAGAAPGSPDAPANNAVPDPAASAAPATAFELKIDPSKSPSADSIAPLLFPGSAAVAVDADGIQLITRESFPELMMGLTPAKAGIAMALLLPAFQQARNAAKAAAEGRPYTPPPGAFPLGGLPAASGGRRPTPPAGGQNTRGAGGLAEP